MAYPTDDIKRLSDRAFGLTFAAIFAAIVLVIWLVSHAVPRWAVVLSGSFLALALFAPWILLPLNRLWMWFTQALGHVVNFVLLGVFFFTLVTTFGLAMRLFGHDPMTRKRDPDVDSYWKPVERHTDAETFKDMF